MTLFVFDPKIYIFLPAQLPRLGLCKSLLDSHMFSTNGTDAATFLSPPPSFPVLTLTFNVIVLTSSLTSVWIKEGE